jgi:UrcA family protein
MFRRSHCLALAAFGACGLMAAALPARAEDAQTSSLQISVGDLDLHSPAGAAVLRQRVHVAALHVCGEPSSFATLEGQSYQSCVDVAERQGLKVSDALIASARAGARYAFASPAN